MCVCVCVLFLSEYCVGNFIFKQNVTYLFADICMVSSTAPRH